MGSFANKFWIKVLAWTTAAIIVVLNVWLVYQTLARWITSAGANALWLWIIVVPLVVAVYFLLMYIALPKAWRKRAPAIPAGIEPMELPPQRFARIGVALDLGDMDTRVLSFAQTLALQNNARMILLHVVEGVGGQLFGKNAYDDEARGDQQHLAKHAEQLRAAGLEVEAVFGFGRVSKEIVRLSKENGIDLLVMGAHGHTGFKDIILGTSISKVRHELKIPVLVIQ